MENENERQVIIEKLLEWREEEKKSVKKNDSNIKKEKKMKKYLIGRNKSSVNFTRVPLKSGWLDRCLIDCMA